MAKFIKIEDFAGYGIYLRDDTGVFFKVKDGHEVTPTGGSVYKNLPDARAAVSRANKAAERLSRNLKINLELHALALVPVAGPIHGATEPVYRRVIFRGLSLVTGQPKYADANTGRKLASSVTVQALYKDRGSAVEAVKAYRDYLAAASKWNDARKRDLNKVFSSYSFGRTSRITAEEALHRTAALYGAAGVPVPEGLVPEEVA